MERLVLFAAQQPPWSLEMQWEESRPHQIGVRTQAPNGTGELYKTPTVDKKMHVIATTATQLGEVACAAKIGSWVTRMCSKASKNANDAGTDALALERRIISPPPPCEYICRPPPPRNVHADCLDDTMISEQDPSVQVLPALISGAVDRYLLTSPERTSPPPYHASTHTRPRLRVVSDSSLGFTPISSLTQRSQPPSISSVSPAPVSNPLPPAYAFASTSLTTRPRSRTTSASSARPRRKFTRPRSKTHTEMDTSDSSPPPYSSISSDSIAPTPVQRASSSPHLHARSSFHMHAFSSPPSSSSLASHPFPQAHGLIPPSYSQSRLQVDATTDEIEDTATSDDGMIFTVPSISIASTLRSRLLKHKRRTQDDPQLRPISTAHGRPGAGETETESEDSPRNLPTARITRPALSPFVPPALPTWFVPFLFCFSRLLSIVPAVIGTLWNCYRAIWLPSGSDPGSLSWRIDFFISMLWSILTGWQCLQLTTGLLKRWRVYYSPLPTLIRLFALQAICWPATHFTLSLLNYEKRPALCWAVIGTTTCYSRSIQLWVTSNIGPAPAPVPSPPSARPTSSPLRRSVLASAGGMREEWMRLRRRRWDWGEVGRKCVLPAGIVYFVMAWADMLRKEWERAGC